MLGVLLPHCVSPAPSVLPQSISDHHSDSRLRNYYGVWIAPPAIAMLAYVSLQDLASFDALQRVLFCA